MSDFFAAMVAVFLILLLVFGTIFGIIYASEKWNCNSDYPAEKKFLAGACYVKQPDGKFVTFNSYVSATEQNLSIKSK